MPVTMALKDKSDDGIYEGQSSRGGGRMHSSGTMRDDLVDKGDCPIGVDHEYL
jgi:hypothetical protein